MRIPSPVRKEKRSAPPKQEEAPTTNRQGLHLQKCEVQTLSSFV